jgi:hypothetical protein
MNDKKLKDKTGYRDVYMALLPGLVQFVDKFSSKILEDELSGA